MGLGAMTGPVHGLGDDRPSRAELVGVVAPLPVLGMAESGVLETEVGAVERLVVEDMGVKGEVRP
jgi:hypothetical protein